MLSIKTLNQIVTELFIRGSKVNISVVFITQSYFAVPKDIRLNCRHYIALAQVKVGNTSKNLLNEIRQIIYSLYQEKQLTKKLYNNVMNSIKLQNRMDTMFMNSENSKTSDPHRLLLNCTDKTDLRKKD